jgi:hypothetical protein
MTGMSGVKRAVTVKVRLIGREYSRIVTTGVTSQHINLRLTPIGNGWTYMIRLKFVSYPS